MNGNGQRAMVPAQQAQLVQVADERDRKIAALYKSMLPGGQKLTDSEALAGAMYAKATGLDPIRGEFYIIPGIGVAPGYKGEQKKKAEKVRFHPSYRQMRPDERQAHGLKDGDIGAICSCMDIDMAHLMRSMDLPYTPTEGIGVVRNDEMWETERWEGPQGQRRKVTLPRDKWEPAEPPRGRSWLWKAQQRALKDALNHMPGFEDLAAELDEEADEIIERAAIDIPDFERPPEGARLSPEQARAWVRAQEAAADRRANPLTDAELHERFERNVEQMRGPADFQGFGDEPDEGEFHTEPEPEPPPAQPPAQHGITDPAQQAVLKKMCTDNGLRWETTIPDVLQTRKWAEYPGTFEEAKAALQKRINDIIDAEAQTDTLFSEEE